MHQFSLIDRYISQILDTDVSMINSGETVIIESPRRLRREISYGFVHALYGIFFNDGRTVFSVTPGSSAKIDDLLHTTPPDIFNSSDQDWLNGFLAVISSARSRQGLSPANRVYEARIFACDKNLVRRYYQGDCRRLNDDSIPPFEGFSLPVHCFPGGLVYGIVVDAHIVSVAYAHRSGLMEDQVADLAVETAPPYQKRGFAKTVVSAVTEQITSSGGEAIYFCSPTNHASIATASSVGYLPYAKAIIVSAPAASVNE
jgi:hypothetical protein